MSLLDRTREESCRETAPKGDSTSTPVSSGEDANPLSIAYLRGLGRRQLRTIGAVALAVGLLSTLFVLTREPRFSSTALLIVDWSGSELVRGNLDRPQIVDTEVQIMRSINIVERVAARLSLASGSKGPAPAPSVANVVERVVTRLGVVLDLAGESKGPAPAPSVAKGSEAKENSSARIQSAELFALQRKFTIRRRGLTDVIAIEASAKTPERAAKLANLYAEVYLEEQVTAKLRSIERVESALALRVDELKAELAQAGAPITLRRLYSDYLSHLREIRQKRSVIMPDLRIAAPALPLEQPSFPSRRLLLLLGVLLALGLAVGVAFVRDRHFFLTARS